MDSETPYTCKDKNIDVKGKSYNDGKQITYTSFVHIKRGKESDKERIKENEEAKERKLLIMWLMVHGVKGSYWFKSVDVGFQGWFWRPNELHGDKGSFSLRLVVFTFSFWKKDAYSRKTNLNYIDSWLSRKINSWL